MGMLLRLAPCVSLLVCCSNISVAAWAQDGPGEAASEVSSTAPAVLAPPPDPLTRAPDEVPEPVGALVGGEGPVVLQGWAADRRWVALCQARRDTNGDGEVSVAVGYHGELIGDAMVPYLAVGGGPGRRIDAYLGASEDDRWVATVEHGRLLLHDMVAGARLDLTAKGAVARGSTHAFALPPGSFEPTGSHFIYLRGKGTKRRAVVLDPATGDSTVLDHGPGVLVGARLLMGAGFAVAQVAPPGKAPRYTTTTLAGGRCRGPVSSYSTYGGSNISEVLVRVPGGVADGDIFSFVEGHALRTGGDGALVWEDRDGTVRPALPAKYAEDQRAALAEEDRDGTVRTALPAAVDGLVMATGPGRALLLAAPAEERSELVWVRVDRVERLGLALDPPKGHRHGSPVRVFRHWTTDASWFVDVATGQRLALDRELDLEGVWAPSPDRGARALLLRRSDGWAGVVDLEEGTVTTLPLIAAPYRGRQTLGRWAFVQARDGGNVLIDLEERRLVGTVRGGEALALSNDGLLLTGAPQPGPVVTSALARGPLRWVAPTPLPEATLAP